MHVCQTSRCTGVRDDCQPLEADKCGLCGGDGSTCRKATHSLEPFITKTGHVHYKVADIPKEVKCLKILKEPSNIANIALQTKAGRVFFQHQKGMVNSTEIEYRGSLLLYTRTTNGSELVTAWGTVKASFAIKVKLTGRIRDTKGLPVVTVMYVKDKDKDKDYSYSWNSGNWSDCTLTCGGGVTMREVSCIRHRRRGAAVLVQDSFCEKAVGGKPNHMSFCNSFECPRSDKPPVHIWHTENWSTCSDYCGYQTRKVICQEVLPESTRVTVNDSLCNHVPKPPTKNPCQGPTCPECRNKTGYCQFGITSGFLRCDDVRHRDMCCESCRSLTTTTTPTITTTRPGTS